MLLQVILIQNMLKRVGALVLTLLLFAQNNVLAQCILTLEVKDQGNFKLSNQYFNIVYNENFKQTLSNELGQIKLDSLKCNSKIQLQVSSFNYYVLDTVVDLTKRDTKITLFLSEQTIVLDTIEIGHHHELDSKIKFVQEEILSKNLQNTTQLFDDFTLINASSNSTAIQKPFLRQFHSQRLTILEHKLPIRDHNWGIDHGLETGLSHIYDVNFSSTGRETYADYASLSLNNDVFFEPRTTIVGLAYNHVNRKKAFSLQLNKRYKQHFFTLSSDIEKSENIRLNTNEYKYLSSYYKLNNKQLSNTGRDKYFFSLDYKYKEKFSFGIYNNYNKTGLFPGASGLPGAYKLINTNQIQIPFQEMNHFKIHGHFQHTFNKINSFSSNVAFQNNTRKEFEKAGFHGYNPFTKDTLGIQMNFSNIDWQNTYYHHIDSNWCVKLEHAFNLGKNKIEGFDFIIPEYLQLENRASLTLEYIHNPKFEYSIHLSGEQKHINTKAHFISVYQNKQFIGDAKTASDQKYNFMNGDILFISNQKWNKTVKTNLSFGAESRNPEINELNSYGLHHGTYRFEKGNPNLKNERNINVQATLYYEKKVFSWVNSVYAYRFDNYIYLAPSNQFASTTIDGNVVALASTGQLYEYKQNKVQMTGLESEFKIKTKRVETRTGFFYTRSINLDTYLPVTFTPQASLKQEIRFNLNIKKLEKYQSKIVLKNVYMFAQRRVDRNELTTPEGNRLDFYYELSVLKKASKMSLNIGVENVLNQKYYIHVSEYRLLNIPEPARNIFLRINAEF